MTPEQSPVPDVGEVVAGMVGPWGSDEWRRARFLQRVCNGQELTCADRDEDAARQWCRRKGMVEVLKKPRRWSATDLGLAVRAHLEANQ